MIWLENGRIEEGKIVLPHPLPIPEGTEVTVQIDTRESCQPAVPIIKDTFGSLPFFGMWTDRSDMNDSTQWVRKEREQWQRRATRQD